MDAVLNVALTLIKAALELVPSLRQSLAIVEGSEHAPRLAEIMKAGNEARKVLDG